MSNADRNTRTLIICFLCAIFSLVPLRFVEVAQSRSMTPVKETVLGVSSQPEEVVLPEADPEVCLSSDEVKAKVNSIANILKENDLNERVTLALKQQIEEIVDQQCR
jgi:hypothetical protein